MIDRVIGWKKMDVKMHLDGLVNCFLLISLGAQRSAPLLLGAHGPRHEAPSPALRKRNGANNAQPVA